MFYFLFFILFNLSATPCDDALLKFYKINLHKFKISKLEKEFFYNINYKFNKKALEKMMIFNIRIELKPMTNPVWNRQIEYINISRKTLYTNPEESTQVGDIGFPEYYTYKTSLYLDKLSEKTEKNLVNELIKRKKIKEENKRNKPIKKINLFDVSYIKPYSTSLKDFELEIMIENLYNDMQVHFNTK